LCYRFEPFRFMMQDKYYAVYLTLIAN